MLKANDVDNRGRQFLFLSVAYAWVEDGKQNVRNDHAGKHKGGNKHAVCKDEVDVFLQDRFVHEPPDARIGKNNFQYERAAEKRSKQVRASGDVGIERVSECVVQVNAFFGDAACAEGKNVRHSHLVKHGCADHAERSACAA